MLSSILHTVVFFSIRVCEDTVWSPVGVDTFESIFLCLGDVVSIQLPHIYLKGPGTEDTINWSCQGCNTGSGRGKQRTKPSSLALISLAFFTRCFSHPFVPQQHSLVCSPLSQLAASLCSSAAAQREECLRVVCCVCMCERNYSLQSQRPHQAGHNTQG